MYYSARNGIVQLANPDGSTGHGLPSFQSCDERLGLLEGLVILP